MAEKDKKPEIRFPGFTADWEQWRLDEITLKIGSGKTPKGGDSSYVLEGIPLIRSQNVYDDLVDLNDVAYITPQTDEEMKSSRVVKNDVLLNITGASIGRSAVYRLSSDANVNQHVCIIRPVEGYSSDFIQLNLTSPKGQQQINNNQAGGGREGLNFQQIGKMSFLFPSIKEQAQIDSFFRYLDTLIILHQRKYDKLLIVKKSMLEKMFPKDGADVPEIRFAGFTDAWEQRKLGDVADRIVRKNTNLESTLPLTISAQYGLVDQITYFNNRVASRDVSNYYLLKKGEFAYNKSYSEGYPFGAVKRLDLYEMGVLSTLYIIFAPKTDIINSDYLVSYYETNNWHKQVAERAAEGARNHGLLNISADAFFDTELKYPKDTTEQAKIGAFFKQLDNLITLHKRELEKLKNIKKSLLDKMFV